MWIRGHSAKMITIHHFEMIITKVRIQLCRVQPIGTCELTEKQTNMEI